MARILLDIRNSLLGALIFDGDSLLYDCSFDCHSIESPESEGKESTSLEETLFHTIEGKETILSSILSRITKDADITVTSGYLLIADNNLINDTITLPKIKPEDASKIIERKFNPTGALQLHITLIEESTQNQTWSAEYLPAELAKKYQESFKTAGIKLLGITTSKHVAMYAVPGEYIMGAGRVYAMYDLALNAVEGFYFHESRLIHNERFTTDETASGLISGHEEQFRKMKRFKILDGIYRINANFEFSNPVSTIHQLLLCGTHPEIHEISDSLSAAMGVDGFILSDLATVSLVAGRYALLTGYANALQQGVAVDFLHTEILQQRSLRVRTGIYIYALTALLAFVSVAARENSYRKVSAELAGEKQKLSQLKVSGAKTLKLADSIALLKKDIDGNAVFYGLFRELANNLPDGMFLAGINIKQYGGKQTVEILSFARQSPDIHARNILTRLDSYLATSDFLRMSKEPVITVIGTDKNRAVQLKVACELVSK